VNPFHDYPPVEFGIFEHNADGTASNSFTWINRAGKMFRGSVGAGLCPRSSALQISIVLDRGHKARAYGC
jgi:hypothetical protein